MKTRSSMPVGFTAKILSTILLFALALAPVARAAITTVYYWRGGENDPGVSNGGFCSSTTDPIGGRTLQFSPAVFWDSETVVGSAAATQIGSLYCLRSYGAESAGTNAAIPSLTDNFGLELWVRPSTLTGNQCLAYNGNTGSSGWGLYLIGNQYRGLFGGVNYVGTATATANTWTHLALVRNNGTATLYVNGVAAGTLGSDPVAPAGRFAIMGQPQNPALERLNGFLDEVRVFSFAPASFSTSDLLVNRRVVSTTADSGPASLRQAITDLNASGGGVITFSVNGTITLASDLPACIGPMTITGPGTNLLTISGSNSFRLFQLAANTINRIGGLTLANGYTVNDNSGAAIDNLGYTIVTNCMFRSNTVVGGFGGAVANFGTGTLLATNCTFANNTGRGGIGGLGYAGGCGGGGAGMGGAVYTEGAALTVTACTFQSNVAAGGNGGSFGGSGDNGGNGGFPNRGLGGVHPGTVITETGGPGGFGGGAGGGGGAGVGGTGGFGGGGGGGGLGYAGGSAGGFGGAGGAGSLSASGGGGGGGAGLGGAILARTGAVFVVNCTFTSNLATNGIGGSRIFGAVAGNGQGVGGAIFVLDASLNLVGSTFSGNVASTAAPDAFTPSTFIVTSVADSGAGTLRNLVGSANTNADANEIFFLPSLSGQTITLTSGQLTLSNNVTIDASSLPGGIAVSGNNSSRVFEVTTGAIVNLSALKIQNGYAPNGDNPTNTGGGILNWGTLALTNCTLTDNQALQGVKPKGGAIANYLAAARLTLQNCLVSSNRSDAYGGGGIEVNGGVASINQCTFTANSCTNGNGGGIYVEAGSVTLNQCTVSSNSASSGGGVARSGSLTINNSIVAGNVAASGPNISGSFAGAHNLTSGNPLLAPLGNYGGPTATMPPLPGSTAIDGCTDGTSFATDQRGKPRIVGAFADIGAVEGVFNSAFPLVNVTKLGNGNVQFGFTNLSGPSYIVLASTNVAAPVNTWSNLGAPTESPAGVFQFTDLQATNYPQRFYRVQGP